MARTRLYPPSVDPGFPELPPTPSGWSHGTFGDALEVVERPVRLNPEERYRLVTAKRNRGGIALRSELFGREILTKSQFIARAGDFLISRRQIIHGACGVVPDELDGAVVSNEYSTLRTRSGLVMDFLRHYAHTPYFQRTCFHSSHGVDVEKMIFKIDEWLAREFDVPPLSEQKKIAAILASVDEAIEATRAVIEQLQVVKQAMMADLLTRGLPGRYTQFKQTEIGAVPESWGVVPLAELAEFQPGFAFKSTDFCAVGDRLLRGSNVAVGSLDWTPGKTVFFPEERRAEFADYSLEAGDIIVAMDRPFISEGFKIARVSEADLPSLLLQRVGRFRRYRADREFVWALLHSDFVQGHLRVQQKGTDLPHISKGEIEASKVPCPPLDEQARIGKLLAAFDSRLRLERAAYAARRNLGSALMSVLLTGEIRVEPDGENA